MKIILLLVLVPTLGFSYNATIKNSTPSMLKVWINTYGSGSSLQLIIKPGKEFTESTNYCIDSNALIQKYNTATKSFEKGENYSFPAAGRRADGYTCNDVKFSINLTDEKVSIGP